MTTSRLFIPPWVKLSCPGESRRLPEFLMLIEKAYQRKWPIVRSASVQPDFNDGRVHIGWAEEKGGEFRREAIE